MRQRSRTAFPLIPRRRLDGLPFGSARSLRRGRGSDLAGSRPYVPGDPISTIDWRATAKLSTARGDDEFVVRERFADEAPRVVVLCDRRPSMALYPPQSPWLSKPAAVRAACEAIVSSAVAARGATGYLDWAGVPGDGHRARPFWIAPRARSPWPLIEKRQQEAAYDAHEEWLAGALEFLTRGRSALGAGTFLFVLSDFLALPPDAAWIAAAGRRWEIVPVVIQDPVWEQSFPDVGPLTLPLTDPAGRAVLDVRLTRREAREQRVVHAQRRTDLLGFFASLGIDPVLLDADDEATVERAFLEWAERRRLERSGR